MDRHFTIRVDHFFHHVGNSEFETRVIEELHKLKKQGEQIMSDQAKVQVALADLDATTTALSATIDEVVAADAAEDAAFQAQIDALKQQIADGQAIDQAQLDDLAAQVTDRSSSLKAVSEHLKSIGTSPTDPIPDVPPVVVEPPADGGGEPPVDGGDAPAPPDAQSRRR